MLRKTIIFAILSFWMTLGAFAQEGFVKTVKINGRIQADYEFLKRAEVKDGFNGFEFRRVYLSASGMIAPKIKYKIEATFPHASLGFGDMYIKYLGGQYGNFILGSYAEPTGLDMRTSSKYIPFFERAMLTSMQNFRWGAGFHYENFKILDGKLGLQMALTNNGKHTEGFKDPNLEKGNNYVFRVTSAPLMNRENHSVVHLGINYASRPGKDLKFRPENHMGGKYHYVFPDAKKRSELGFELAGGFGPVSLQGEYKTQSVSTRSDKTFDVAGYYAMASFFVTGEHRPYKHGAFGRVKPRKNLGQDGGFGALELLLRYSNMTPAQEVLDVNPGLPKTINNITAGINWYLNPHTRIMYNLVLTDDGNDTDGKMTGHLFRAQVDF